MKMKRLMKVAYVIFILSPLIGGLIFSSCSNDDGKESGYDPLLPVEITSFYPDSGGVGTQILIHGANFGTDKSKVKVFVNEKLTPVIGVEGNSILAQIPSRTDTGYVKVQIGIEDEMQEAISENKYKYIFRPNVSTLAGFTDKDGKTAIVDGSFEDAQFEEPYWLTYDQYGNLFLLEQYRGLRYIDFEKEEVTTKFRTGNGLDRPRTLAFNLTWDTLYITNDQWDERGLSTAVITSASNFTEWYSMIYSKTCNGGAVQPQSGEYFYNEFDKGYVYKWDRENKISKQLFRVDDVRWEFNIQFAPSGDYALMVSKNQHYILKSRYNRETNELEAPIHFVGGRGQAGWGDGVGVEARFDEPHQGAFDEFDNFYVTDTKNHCIRKVTPEGIVTTFAGRPRNYGYSDGALRDAQFDQPHGIAYDQETGVFYVADMFNRRIRKISIE